MVYDDQTYTKGKNLKGHICKGFKQFQKEDTKEYGTCSPFINDKGLIEGCDNANGTKLKFCPFCGKKLNDASNNEGAGK